jgi:hypothetical protein
MHRAPSQRPPPAQQSASGGGGAPRPTTSPKRIPKEAPARGARFLPLWMIFRATSSSGPNAARRLSGSLSTAAANPSGLAGGPLLPQAASIAS